MSQSYTGKIFKRSVGMHDLHHLFIYEMVFRSSTQTEGIKTWQPMIAVKKKEEPSFKADAEQTNKYGQEQTKGACSQLELKLIMFTLIFLMVSPNLNV